MEEKTATLRNHEFGKFAEQIAVDNYISKGYAIRERNWRHGYIEIDLIAQIENIIVFVEVKARSGKDMSAIDSVNLKKMKSMTRGADIYLKSLTGDYEYRYDIFALTGDFNNFVTELLEDAFISPLF